MKRSQEEISNIAYTFTKNVKSVLAKDDLFQRALKPIKVMDIEIEVKCLMVAELIHYITSRYIKENRLMSDQDFDHAQILFEYTSLKLAEKYLKGNEWN